MQKFDLSKLTDGWNAAPEYGDMVIRKGGFAVSLGSSIVYLSLSNGQSFYMMAEAEKQRKQCRVDGKTEIEKAISVMPWLELQDAGGATSEGVFFEVSDKGKIVMRMTPYTREFRIIASQHRLTVDWLRSAYELAKRLLSMGWTEDLHI